MGLMTRAQQKLTGAGQYLTQPRVPVATWEYAVIHVPERGDLDALREQLNTMGSYGWELCERRDTGTGTTRGDGYVGFLFKRRTT